MKAAPQVPSRLNKKPRRGPRRRGRARRLRIGSRIVVATLLALGALAAVLYDPFSQWWNDRLHAQVIAGLSEATVVGPEKRLEQERDSAYEYNRRLVRGGSMEGYFEELNLVGNGVMGRVKIPKIDVDLPIFHTSSDSVLRKGAGHMEETTLPVGGENTHAAITAHRGLAASRLFTDLDKVGVGDRFTLEVAGDVLTYEVFTTRVVKPDETQWLAVKPGEDLVTLITCDPLGINTERILVTGERVTPTPLADIQNSNAPKDMPGVPGWIWRGLAGLSIIGLATWYFSGPNGRMPSLTGTPNAAGKGNLVGG